MLKERLEAQVRRRGRVEAGAGETSEDHTLGFRDREGAPSRAVGSLEKLRKDENGAFSSASRRKQSWPCSYFSF